MEIEKDEKEVSFGERVEWRFRGMLSLKYLLKYWNRDVK